MTFADGTGGGSRSALPSALLAPTGLAVPSVDSGLAGTAEEQQVVAIALAPEGGGEPSALTTLLAGPMLRGRVVNQ